MFVVKYGCQQPKVEFAVSVLYLWVSYFYTNYFLFNI